ncbi:MAG: YkgJ family cysteine cluster protein [Planctomycetota bacterium]
MNSPKNAKPPAVPDVLAGRRQLGPQDEFCFACHSMLECFTRCCHDVNILLTPVDVLRLARRIGLSTTDFLDQHTSLPITKDLHLPVVALRMAETPEKPCPFLGKGAAGCTVYADRPWACRMYPIGMALPPARAGVDPKPLYFLFEDSYCKGGGEPARWTVDAWRADQEIASREELEQGFQEIVSHPWFIGGRQLDPPRMQMFHTACFDLDSFRRFVFQSTFLRRFALEPELVEELRVDDAALLRFGFRWLRYALFGEPTLKLHDSAAGSGRNP